MRYSDDIIEEVRMKNDIVDVVSQICETYQRKASSYFGLCPFHNEKIAFLFCFAVQADVLLLWLRCRRKRI